MLTKHLYVWTCNIWLHVLIGCMRIRARELTRVSPYQKYAKRSFTRTCSWPKSQKVCRIPARFAHAGGAWRDHERGRAMGNVYRETYTRPMPNGAELFTRKGERFARWTDAHGRKRVAKVTTPAKGTHAGTDRIIVEAATYTAKYRNGAGQLVKTATGCRTRDAAETVLNELRVRSDKVRSGSWTAAEDAVLDFKATPVGEHVDAYLQHLQSKRGKGKRPGVSPRHVENVRHCLKRIVGDCGFKRLRDLNRGAVERWADRCDAAGMAARTVNRHLAALTAFGNWCVESGRIVANPFTRPPKRDEKADPRRTRRALTEIDLRRLLKVARLRLLAEYGRTVVKRDDAADRSDKRSRRTWTREPLVFDDLDAAAERDRHALRNRPGVIDALDRRGRERALIYKTLVMTGLRKGELAALTVRHVELDGTVPYFVLDAADEKAGRGAEIPLRADLAADVRAWLAERLERVQNAARDAGRPLPVRLAADDRLFNVPSGLVRILDRDLVAAGIAKLVVGDDGRSRIDKRDDRGRTVDVHALRHTFGTHLSKGGVSPRTAQAAMRHGSLDLTMNTYTDPRLLDVAGALDVLPDLPLNEPPGANLQRATGTTDARPGVPRDLDSPRRRAAMSDAESARRVWKAGDNCDAETRRVGDENGRRNLVPNLVPLTGDRSTPMASADSLAETGDPAGNAASDAADECCRRVSLGGTKRATRLERATFSLEG
ncbi:MAG: site-specific integrase [Phycisphaerales bacterium]|nr:site-specific integrase [Phycisphaerales bacterium]